jgi:signal transduction histidine kinase
MLMPTNTTILIVDDQPTNLGVLYDALARADYTVRVVNSGEAALASARRAMPQLILLDAMMPGLDGFETCRRLKADPTTSEAPVIFMTALTDPMDEVTGLQLGAVDYITKPIQIDTVLARISTHLTLHQLQQTLQQRNAELDAYARMVAHDLKTPLTAVLGTAQYLLRNADHFTHDDLMAYLTIIWRAGQRAVTTIDELLALAGVRQTEVILQPLDMAAIIEQARARIAFVLEQYAGVLVLPDTWPVARGHAAWVELVWANYISNGLKYGGEPPRVELGAARQADGMIQFWVQDNGPGLAPESCARLFTEGTRLDPTRAEGHGLGLAMVRRIVEKLGGVAWVESTIGQGSRFYFTLLDDLSAICPPE